MYDVASVHLKVRFELRFDKMTFTQVSERNLVD